MHSTTASRSSSAASLPSRGGPVTVPRGCYGCPLIGAGDGYALHGVAEGLYSCAAHAEQAAAGLPARCGLPCPRGGEGGGFAPPAQHPEGGALGGAETRPGAEGAGGAEGAPLILIEGHLTDGISAFVSATGFRAGSVGGRLLKNWSFPSDWQGCDEAGEAHVLKIQSFASGGYEATLRKLNLKRIGAAMEYGGRRGKREKPEEGQERGDVLKAASRAKRRIRYLAKNMMATNLVTFSKREGPNVQGWGVGQWEDWCSGGRERWEAENSSFWSEDDWLKAWDKFRRNLERASGKFPYVAVLERHRKGNFHLHVAWLGKVNLNLVRPIWWASCGGRGLGNVQSQFIRVRAGAARSDRVARYISKYVSKGFAEEQRFNKKRYWASRQTLDDVRRIVLRSRDFDSAFSEVRRLLRLELDKFLSATSRGLRADNIFLFPDDSGVWINFLPDVHATDPPF